MVEAAPTVSAYLDRVAFEVRPGRGRPISNAVETFFALGLLAAAHACELLGADRFSSEVSVQDLLQALCEIDIGGENDPFPPPGEFDCLGELTRELIKLEPRLKYMLVACVKLARLEAQDDDTGGFIEHHQHFVFIHNIKRYRFRSNLNGGGRRNINGDDI